MVAFTKFRTSTLPRSERLEQWGGMIWKVVGGLRTEVDSPGDFLGSALFGRIGDIHLCQLSTASAHKVYRQASLISRDDRDLVKVALQQNGRSSFTQGGAEVLLQPGEWALYDTSRPYEVACAADTRQLIVLIPRKHLGLGNTDIGRIAARALGQAGGTARLVPRYISGLFKEGQELGERNTTELSGVALQLIRMALQEAIKDAPFSPSRDILRAQMKDYIKRNLDCDSLSIETVAAHFGCTKRYIHKIFQDDELTASDFIWDCRLIRCGEALRDAKIAHRSVTEIAFMCGFNNAAHFSRAFRRRYGMPPSHYRHYAASH